MELNPEQLKDAIECSRKLDELIQDDCCTMFRSEYCFIHVQRKRDLFCKICKIEMCGECATTTHTGHECVTSVDAIDDETWRLEEAGDGVVDLLEEVKRAVSGVQEMKRRVRDKKHNDVTATREAFNSLRKAINEREEQTVVDIREEADKKEKCLELQLQRLLFLCAQLKRCLDIIKKTNERNLRAEELANRRIILEQWNDHLAKMKSRLEPVRSVRQKELKFDNVDQLCQAVNKLGFTPLDPSKCEVIIPPVTVKKMATITITLRDKNENLVTDGCQEINVSIKNVRGDEAIQVRAIEEVGGGIYKASFVTRRCGYYKISVTIDDCHVPGNPYIIPVDRDYNTLTEQDCSNMVTHYEGKEFGRLNDIAIGPNREAVIIDYGNRRIVVLDDKLNLLKLIDQESGDSLLANPNGVAVNENVIVVSDYGSHQVKKYSWQGELLSVIGCYGRKDGQFNYPRGLAFNANDMLYVIDGENFRIQVFHQDDTFAFSFGSKELGPGQLRCPVRIAVDPKNNVLVTDIFANCIQVFDHSGQFIQAIECRDPWAIAISPTGYLITGHHGGGHKIQIWSPTYQLIKRFGRKGLEQGEFYGVIGLAMDTFGTLYIVEYFNKRLQVISL